MTTKYAMYCMICMMYCMHAVLCNSYVTGLRYIGNQDFIIWCGILEKIIYLARHILLRTKTKQKIENDIHI